MYILAGLSCIEKRPNIKAIGIYTFPCIRTAEFAPPALGGGSTSLFQSINTLKWRMFDVGASSIYSNRINKLRASIGLPAMKLDYSEMIQTIFHRPMLTATIYSRSLLQRRGKRRFSTT